jgi:NAD(P)-dependent dehydrogenase (short-subunit alcohol dehydrogenase family)
VNSATFDFSGSRVLVTGGTSGIGHAVAVAFRDAGASVEITGRRESAETYDTDLAGLGYHQLEMADADATEELGRSFGSLDVLVNNAGANFPGGRDEWIPDVFEDALTLNLSGAFRLTMASHDALRASTAAGGASVVNMVSMSAFLAVPIVPGYGSAKAGLLELTRNLAAHWVGEGIRVNAVAPGVIETPMTAPMQDIPALVDEQLVHIPMHRFGRVAEVAPAVLFLCTAHASYMTGGVLAVDGGYQVLQIRGRSPVRSARSAMSSRTSRWRWANGRRSESDPGPSSRSPSAAASIGDRRPTPSRRSGSPTSDRCRSS